MTGAIITGLHHTRSDLTTRAIEPRWAETATIAALIHTRTTVVTALLSTVVYGKFAVTT